MWEISGSYCHHVLCFAHPYLSHVHDDSVDVAQAFESPGTDASGNGVLDSHPPSELFVAH